MEDVNGLFLGDWSKDKLINCSLVIIDYHAGMGPGSPASYSSDHIWSVDLELTGTLEPIFTTSPHFIDEAAEAQRGK